MTIAPLDCIVVEPVLLVPKGKLLIFAGSVCHRVGNVQEMLEELHKVSLIHYKHEEAKTTLDAMSSYVGLCFANSRAMLSLNLSVIVANARTTDLHVEAKERHPSGSIRLSQCPASW